MSRLINFINENYKKTSKEKTIKELGNRSQYIGFSDRSCQRKVVLSKMQQVDYSLEQLIIFGRGHFAETIGADILKGLKYKQQVEVESVCSNGFPKKGHIDFVVESEEKKAIRVLRRVNLRVKRRTKLLLTHQIDLYRKI